MRNQYDSVVATAEAEALAEHRPFTQLERLESTLSEEDLAERRANQEHSYDGLEMEADYESKEREEREREFTEAALRERHNKNVSYTAPEERLFMNPSEIHHREE